MSWFKKKPRSKEGPLPPLPLPPLQRWERFLGLQRNQEVKLVLAGRPFWVPDPLSFYWSYKEIVQDRLYDFPSTTNHPRILDLGANCGLSALFFLLRYPHTRLTCVEADPHLFSVLERNIRPFAPVSQVDFHHAAVAAIPGEMDFYASGGDSGRLAPHVSLPSKVQRVPSVTLDSLIDGPVDLLKIDIEGSETESLLASRKLDQVRRLFVEYHSFVGQEGRLDELLACLRRTGFRTWIQTQFCPLRPFHEIRTQADMDLQLNLFALRPS